MFRRNKRKKLKAKNTTVEVRKEKETAECLEEEETQQLESAGMVFSIDLIIEQILDYLPIKDLLACSLVNKHWNFKSRKILHHDRQTFIKIRRLNGYASILRLIELLRNPNPEFQQPFNGIKFYFFDRNYFIYNGKVAITHKTDRLTASFINSIFTAIKIKHVVMNFESMTFRQSWAQRTFIPLVRWEDVETFRTEGVDFSWNLLLKQIDGSKFSNLRSFQTSQYHRYPQEEFSCLKRFLEFCTSMTKWVMPVLPCQVQDFLDLDKTSMIEWLDIDITSENMTTIKKACLTLKQLGIPKVKLTEEFISTVTEIVQSSLFSLEIISLCDDTFKELLTTNFPILVNVRTIIIKCQRDCGLTEEEEKLIFENPVYQKIFPNVKLPWKFVD